MISFSKTRMGHTRRVLLAGLLAGTLGWGVGTTRSQESGSPFIYYPSTLPAKTWQLALGATFTTPPKELTEEVQVRAPAIDFHALYGLPSHFYLDGRVISQLLQNHISVGGRWTRSMGDFSVGAGYDVAYWFGFLTIGGFDSKANGWINYPSVTIGYNTGDVRLLFKTEAILNLFYRSYVGENEVESDANTFSGMSFMLAMEQPFWKDTHVTFGFRVTYTKFNWIMWSLYTTFDRYLYYPEFIVGFML